MGLKEYMSRQLAQRARQMLGTIPDMPVWEVAETLGFTDPYYFSRFFKNMKNYPPGNTGSCGFNHSLRLFQRLDVEISYHVAGI